MHRIEEIIELIEITGDKCIILHKKTAAYVVMKLDDYKGFFKNQLKSSGKKDVLPSSRQPSADSLVRPVPQKPTDIKEFEILRSQFSAEPEDTYYPEPLIE